MQAKKQFIMDITMHVAHCVALSDGEGNRTEAELESSQNAKRNLGGKRNVGKL